MACRILFTSVLFVLACHQDIRPYPDPALHKLRTYQSAWSELANGSEPSDFMDVRSDGYHYPWLYDGRWQITHRGDETLYAVPLPNTRLPEPLTFRRYNGEDFGPDGLLPSRYRVTVQGRSLGGATRFNGYGELAVEVYYLSPVTYVEVLQTDTQLLIWQAIEAPPMQGSGWRLLAHYPHPAAIGEWVNFGAIVDTKRGRCTALLNGRPVASTFSPLLKDVPHGLTLRATGNREEWRSLTIQELPDKSAERP